MKHERILLDIEVQRDLFDRAGSFYTKPAAEVAGNIYRLFAWARKNRIPVVSTVLRVRPDRLGPLVDVPHCVDGSGGERKLLRTILPRRINFGLRNITDLPLDLFRRYQQAIFEKRYTDIFLHERAERLITELRSGTFILCGAGVAKGIVEAAVGLRFRGFGVVVASDAVLDLGDRHAAMARLRMEAKGVVFVPTDRIVAPALRRPVVRFRTAMSAGG